MPKKQGNQMKCVLLGGPEQVGFHMESIPGDDVYVVLTDVGGTQELSALAFHSDPQPGFGLAHVWRSGMGWFIEASSSGTVISVDDEPIPDKSPIKFQPGARVESNGIRWTVIPEDWLYILNKSVLIVASCVHTINYASYHCGAPIVEELLCYNVGRQRSDSMQLVLRVVGYTDPCSVTIPALEPFESTSVEAPFFRFHVRELRSQVEPMPTQLTVEIGGREYPEATREVQVLGIWSWSYDKEARSTLAAFVCPQNTAIQRTVRGAEAKLNSEKGVSSFLELLQSRRGDRVKVIFQRLYDYLREDCELRWCPPEGSRHYQRIKPPQEILDNPGGPDKGQATCIDLALLIAGCLENAGLYPVVILTAGDDANPRHALVGCWLGSTSGGASVVDNKGSIRKDVDTGTLLVAESTGVASVEMTRPDGLTFADAHSSAQDQINRASWLCAIDIMALRPEDGIITPIDCPREATVERAYQESERLARSKGRTVVETKFLFYGCLKANGKVIQSWSRQMGINTEDLCEGIDRLTSRESSSGELVLSTIYADCQRLAEDIAWWSRSAYVREQDLLLSLVNRGRTSRSLLKVCSKLKIDIFALEDHIRQSCGYFVMPTSFTSYASKIE